MKSAIRCGLCFLLICIPSVLPAQMISKMDFRNQSIADILMVLADMGKKSIVIDETVTGTATFYFGESSFEEALRRFAEACNLFVEPLGDAYYVSRMRVTNQNGLVSITAEEVDIETVVKNLARSAGKTILYDQLPRSTITLYNTNSELRNILEVVVKRFSDYTVLEENGAFYIQRAAASSGSTAGRLSSSAITRNGETFAMNIPRGSFTSIIATLFRTGGREYSLLQRIDSTLENLYFEDKTFDQLLHLVLEQGNCDYVESNGVYYIFEIQRRDVLKKFKDTIVVQLQHLSVNEVIPLLPSEYAGPSFIKTNLHTNSLYLTGSTDEIKPIADFIALLDVPLENKNYRRFEIQYLDVKDFITLLPKKLAEIGPTVLPGSNAFIVQVNDEQDREYRDFITLTDIRSGGVPIRLKYITSDELSQHLPPSVAKEEIVLSTDPTLIFFTGTAEKQKQFLADLALVDQPKPQIRYQLLVIQYQKSDNLNWNKSITVSPSSESASRLITGTFSNLLNINFDIVSELGFQLAMQINLQIGEDRARVLADTTLNGLSGQEIKFENTTTFRYRDVAIDPETGKPLYTGTTREINSGLTLGINGWVSGDGMITMQVNAAVSKQDESGADTSTTTNPPPTSERIVNTQVRTKSGTPIIIGGLLQVEKVESIKKLPLLGSIPVLGRLFQDRIMSDSVTEMVIYIVPFIHHGPAIDAEYEKKIDAYFKKFVSNEEV